MIKFENTEVVGWEHAIRGMRNPKNSWDKSDSYEAIDCSACGRLDRESHCIPKDHMEECEKYECYEIGENDLKLMTTLRNAGTDHRKYLRMITVYVDITAPLYWWKEFDTYKVGTVANSCSTMHKIHDKEFTLDDFSHEHLDRFVEDTNGDNAPVWDFKKPMEYTIEMLNKARTKFLETKDKKYWWQLIQLLPSSYNQKRTVMMNYEVLNNIYKSRKNHKLDEWSVGFMKWIETLPYAKELIIGG